MTSQRKAILYGLSAVLLWSTVATAFKLSLRYFSPIELLLYSGSFSTLLLGAILLCQRKFHLAFQCSLQEYLLSICLGLLSPFLYYLILFKAYDLLPAQQAQPLNYTWAITLSLLAVPLLKQKIGWQQWLALLVSYCGVVVISTEGKPFSFQFTDPLGVGLALASTIVWALYWIYNTRDSRDPVVGLFVNFLCSFPFVLGYYLLTTDVRMPPVNGLLGAAYVGTFEMGACFVLWLLAMKTTDSTAKISNLIFLSPFLSLIFIYFLVGEKILAATFIGLILIVAGLFCQRLK
ncbi:MAG: DMT family transporter [Deltaproteobacteria bacterium]|jgi:drug/metabolite transporter (DMT)-like permease|nr:DMT family transporter [Deltaproteobacteria bacterium]MCW8894140.1 DMT family transporter [Deltaproteobacteria bacterium]MCW9048931.1 DMT family transporter [Deltaproteobacteria bacterium]